MRIHSNTAENEQKSGHQRSTSQQDWAPAIPIDHEGCTQSTEERDDIIENTQEEGVCEALLFVKNDTVLAGECLAGNLLEEHGENCNDSPFLKERSEQRADE